MKLATDESGVALGLAVMVVVVVGVMGAGLLVFARNDLESVIRVNQGQRAFYAADAGVQAAKRQLLSDASPASYDDDGSGDACDSPLDEDEPVSSEWSNGAARDFEDGDFVVEIRWLNDGCGAPSGVPKAEYFEITSTGTSGEATRKVEAVYAPSDVGAPLANYAAGDVAIGGTSAINGVSVFGSQDVELQDSESLQGDDATYPGWSSTDSPAGVGAVGDISGDRAAVGTRDFDGGSDPRFVEEVAEGGSEPTFPFDPDYFRRASVLDFLKEEATAQGNLQTSGGSLSWPEDSTSNTVVYVEFDGSAGTLKLSSDVCSETSGCRGTLVVENGSYTMEDGSVFSGAVVVAGGENPNSLSATVESGASLEGFASSSGPLSINGEISALPVEEARLRPGFYGVEVWSWRELYE